MTDEIKIPLILICGATASGKTGLGVEIAERYNGEVISADSMQIYKKMNIATAKPTKEEMRGIKHHLIDYVEPYESYSVADYVKKARNTIVDIYSRGKIPVMVGGTGLYINSVLENIEFGEENSSQELRDELNKRIETEGKEVLLKELAKFDPQTAERIGLASARRIVRAIEVYRTTGKTMTQFIAESKLKPSPYNDVRIGLSCEDRQNLYDRINRRVDLMVEMGLIEEAKEFLKNDYSSTSTKAIGYKELEPYFAGEITLNEALENLKRETRRYAKRQLTWFRRDEKINWIFSDVPSSKSLVEQAVAIIEKSKILDV